MQMKTHQSAYALNFSGVKNTFVHLMNDDISKHFEYIGSIGMNILMLILSIQHLNMKKVMFLVP
jgi:hypothetical protein